MKVAILKPKSRYHKLTEILMAFSIKSGNCKPLKALVKAIEKYNQKLLPFVFNKITISSQRKNEYKLTLRAHITEDGNLAIACQTKEILTLLSKTLDLPSCPPSEEAALLGHHFHFDSSDSRLREILRITSPHNKTFVIDIGAKKSYYLKDQDSKETEREILSKNTTMRSEALFQTYKVPYEYSQGGYGGTLESYDNALIRYAIAHNPHFIKKANWFRALRTFHDHDFDLILLMLKAGANPFSTDEHEQTGLDILNANIAKCSETLLNTTDIYMRYSLEYQLSKLKESHNTLHAITLYYKKKRLLTACRQYARVIAREPEQFSYSDSATASDRELHEFFRDFTGLRFQMGSIMLQFYKPEHFPQQQITRRRSWYRDYTRLSTHFHDSNKWRVVIRKAKDGNYAQLNELLTFKPEPPTLHMLGAKGTVLAEKDLAPTPLHLAAIYGNDEIYGRILQRWPKLETREDANHLTPLALKEDRERRAVKASAGLAP